MSLPAISVLSPKLRSRLGQFVGAHPEIAEIDVNPLVVSRSRKAQSRSMH